MATILFSSIVDGSTVEFDPLNDVLMFDDAAVSAASVGLSFAPDFTSIAFVAGGISFTLKDTAITVGNTISYGRGSNPSGFGAYGDSTVEIGRHEQAHTYQYQVLGPLFLPTYFLRGGISGPTGNPFEHAAQEYGSGRGGWWE